MQDIQNWAYVVLSIHTFNCLCVIIVTDKVLENDQIHHEKCCTLDILFINVQVVRFLNLYTLSANEISHDYDEILVIILVIISLRILIIEVLIVSSHKVFYSAYKINLISIISNVDFDRNYCSTNYLINHHSLSFLCLSTYVIIVII